MVTPPSTCISLKRRPAFSTSRYTGGNNPGMLEEARSTFWKSPSAPGAPEAAIAPMFQATGRPVSTLVVITKRRRPRRCSVAMSAMSSAVTSRSINLASGQVSRRLSFVAPNSKMSAALTSV
jgi:hypothetical protein